MKSQLIFSFFAIRLFLCESSRIYPTRVGRSSPNSVCSVVNRTAQCESSDLITTVKNLPTDLLTLSVSLHGYDVLVVPHMFDKFIHIQEITIFAANQTVYDSTSIDFKTSLHCYQIFQLPTLEVLRLKVKINDATWWLGEDTFKSTGSLRVLDLSRSREFGIVRFQNATPALANSQIRALILKNIQRFRGYSEAYSTTVTLSKFVCTLRNTLEILDLSYNDFSFLDFGSPACLPRLRYLDLQHNFLMTVGADTGNSPYQLLHIFNWALQLSPIETLKVGNQWHLVDYHTQIWDDKTPESLPSLPGNHRSFLARIMDWFRHLAANCAGLSFRSVVLCLPEFSTSDRCRFIKCLAPHLNKTQIDLCRRDFTSFWPIFVTNLCPVFSDCFFGAPIPFTIDLREVDWNNVNHPGKESVHI